MNKGIYCYDCKFKNKGNDMCEKHNDNMKVYNCKDFVSILAAKTYKMDKLADGYRKTRNKRYKDKWFEVLNSKGQKLIN